MAKGMQCKNHLRPNARMQLGEVARQQAARASGGARAAGRSMRQPAPMAWTTALLTVMALWPISSIFVPGVVALPPFARDSVGPMLVKSARPPS